LIIVYKYQTCNCNKYKYKEIKNMNVLSLFDGMSCGRIALDRLGIKVDNYYASEIDKYAMTVSAANYPGIIQVGDVTQLDTSSLPQIDLIMGGSPCQGFSFAGKQLAFDDPRSALFFEFVRCVEELKPKYFLLENVRMKKEYLDVISEYMGVEPICINSALLSAQNRVRFYWTNIPGIEQPEQRGIVLRDILETNPDNNLDKMTNKQGKSYALTASYNGAVAWNSLQRKQRTMIPTDKPVKVGMNVEQVKVRKHEVDIISLQYLLREMKKESSKTNKQIAEETNTPITKAEHWFRTDSSFAIPSDEIWLKLKEVLSIKTDIFDKQIMEFEYRDGVYESKQRVYSENGKSPTLTAGNKDQYIETHDTPKQVGTAVDIKGHDQIKKVYSEDGKSSTLTTCGCGHREPKVAIDNIYWRKLTPVECERLQTVPDNYTNHVSNTQRYKMLGNGWTIEVICHILKKIKEDI
jgi:DNA (cytosine-5)-methyltransferase 3A